MEEKDKRWRIVQFNRMVVILPYVAFAFYVILLDSAEIIDVGKWGYAAIFSPLVAIINFFIRKNPKDKKDD